MKTYTSGENLFSNQFSGGEDIPPIKPTIAVSDEPIINSETRKLQENVPVLKEGTFNKSSRGYINRILRGNEQDALDPNSEFKVEEKKEIDPSVAFALWEADSIKYRKLWWSKDELKELDDKAQKDHFLNEWTNSLQGRYIKAEKDSKPPQSSDFIKKLGLEVSEDPDATRESFNAFYKKVFNEGNSVENFYNEVQAIAKESGLSEEDLVEVRYLASLFPPVVADELVSLLNYQHVDKDESSEPTKLSDDEKKRLQHLSKFVDIPEGEEIGAVKEIRSTPKTPSIEDIHKERGFEGIDYGAVSTINGRKKQQDAVGFTRTDKGFQAVVADGNGDYGEIVATDIRDRGYQYFNELRSKGVSENDAYIKTTEWLSNQHLTTQGGAVAVMAELNGNKLTVASVGDSLVWAFGSDGYKVRMSGEPHHLPKPNNNVIYRGIATQNDSTPNISTIEDINNTPAEFLVMCSDGGGIGHGDHIEPDEAYKMISTMRAEGKSFKEIGDSLTALAKQKTDDNITFLIIDLKSVRSNTAKVSDKQRLVLYPE